MIKNNTPYKGRLKFKFEKYPHYTDETVLNKVHLDLGFTKLVSRISSAEVDPAKVELINRYTGGRIASYKLNDYPGPDGGILPNSFVTLRGDYVGDIRVGWWYYLNDMTICEDYPAGVAEIWEDDEIVAYYGYSHRGGASFKIGDRLFKADYTPMAKHYEPWQWAGWELQYENDLQAATEEAKETGNTWWAEDIKKDGIGRYIPFNMKGKHEIKTLAEAKQAAINISEYLG